MMPQNLISVYTNCYAKYGVEVALENIPKLGIRYVELALKDHRGHLVIPRAVIPDIFMDVVEIEAFKDRLEALGLTITSAHGSGDLSTRDGIDAVKARLDFASRLGVKIFTTSVAPADAQATRRELYDSLLHIGDFAAARGVTVSLEVHPGIVRSGRECLRTMKDLDHDHLRISFDTANIYYYNEDVDAEEELELIAEYVVHVHVKDSRRRYREWYFPALGEGTVNLKRVFEILNTVGFCGPFSIEIEGIAGEEERTLPQIQERLEKSVNHLREVGCL